MTRGDLVTATLSGDYGKPRPVLVIQSDYFSDHPSVAVLPVTSQLRDAPLFRVTVEADTANNLRETSQIMVDKVGTIPRDKIGNAIGTISREGMLTIERCLALFRGLAD